MTWLEDDFTEVSIHSSGVGDVTEAAMSLAESLIFIEAHDAWASAEADQLGQPVGGDPILGGVIAGIDWDVVLGSDGLTLRSGDLDRETLIQPFGSGDDLRYSIVALAIPSGSLIVGDAPSTFDQLELLLEGGETILIPTVQLDNGRAAFAIPVDDRLDPIEARFLSEGVATEGSIYLAKETLYAGGVSSTG